MTRDLDDFCELLFEASNEDRLRILGLLNEEMMSVTMLSKRMGMGTQEMSRHVNRLTECGIVARDTEGLNGITPYGRLTLSQLAGLRFTTRNRHYFSDHTLGGLPEAFVNRLGELEGSTYLEDTILVFDHIERMIREAEEYVYRITDGYMTSLMPVIEEALERGVDYRLLSPENVVFPTKFRMGQVMTRAEVKGQFKVRSNIGPNVFLAMSEKEVSSLGFPNHKGKMDHYGFSSGDRRFKGWCLDLFNYCWEKSKPKPKEILSRYGTFEERS